MKLFKRNRIPHNSSGTHLVIINETRHEIIERGTEVLIDGVEFKRTDAIAHLKNIAAGCDHIARMLTENPK